MSYYILVDHTPVAEPDIHAWARWYETADRVVRRTVIHDGLISTVFLGLDHLFSKQGAPLLFETMVFCDGEGTQTFRCSTWEQAEAQHERVVKMALEQGL